MIDFLMEPPSIHTASESVGRFGACHSQGRVKTDMQKAVVPEHSVLVPVDPAG
jgi:hypothetical protein